MQNSILKRFHHQQGTSAVEFALIAIVFFTLLLGIIEFGRLFYVWNTVQEVTRRAAREAVVRWVSDADTAKNLALFGGTALPAGAEVTTANITIDYLAADGSVPSPFPASATDNISACLAGPTGCIATVRVSISGASYVPMIGLFTFLSIPLPASTVTMPAESLGYHL
ncbi:MAG: TadE/TadG family type IV pilus assembly protein [Formivibrio sp.]|nr:TadE/TadG family type IV pilus assembly protein [Formivibrio sp.]